MGEVPPESFPLGPWWPAARVVLSCEHARVFVPRSVDLGLEEAVVQTHIGWDRGALPLAEALAERLEAPLFAGEVSRLVVDLNRREGHPGVIPAESFGIAVPGNRALPDDERERRLARFHRPWRRAVTAEVDDAVARGGCLHLSLHSFDPTLSADRAGLDIGVLHDPARPREHRIALALRDALGAAGLRADLDRPYLGTDEGLTTWLRERHAHGYVGIELELSQAWAGDERVRRAVVDAVESVEASVLSRS